MEELKSKIAEIADDYLRYHDLMTGEEVADKIISLISKTEPVADVLCNVGLFCRVRSEGETMRSGDIVLINDTFRPLGFHTDFYHYFAGLKVVEGMTGKIICKAT